MKQICYSLLITLLVFNSGNCGLLAGESSASTATEVVIQRDVEFGKGGDKHLRLNLLRPKKTPKEPMPVIVYIYGGAFRSGTREQGLQWLKPFAERGYLCASIEYRHSQEALFPAQIEDCKCAIRFLRAKAKEYHLIPERIGVWGHSAGGYLAALLGTSGGIRELEGQGGWPEYPSHVNAVVDCYGPTDFLQMDAAGSQMKHDAPTSPE